MRSVLCDTGPVGKIFRSHPAEEMGYFETIIARLLEEEGFWVRHSVRANLSKPQKVAHESPSMPGPEIDILAYRPNPNELLFLEVKSFLDSPWVKVEHLPETEARKANRYKFLTSPEYQRTVIEAIVSEYQTRGLIVGPSTVRAGLAVGNASARKRDRLRRHAEEMGWFYWGPEDIARRVRRLADGPSGNPSIVVTAKILEHNSSAR